MKSFFRTIIAVIFIAAGSTAFAAPLVVGSVNPETNQVTIFQDLLVKRFLDKTPISNIYGKYDEVSNGFLMIRSGKTAAGACQTDAFKLVRLAGNRLALAASQWTAVPWDGIGSVLHIKRCFKGSCQGSCQVLGNPDTPFDLTDYICFCTSGQQCEVGLQLPHQADDIVVETPVP